MNGDGLPICPHVLHLVPWAMGDWWQQGGNCYLLCLSMLPHPLADNLQSNWPL